MGEGWHWTKGTCNSQGDMRYANTILVGKPGGKTHLDLGIDWRIRLI